MRGAEIWNEKDKMQNGLQQDHFYTTLLVVRSQTKTENSIEIKIAP